jgi:hypothetical protein
MTDANSSSPASDKAAHVTREPFSAADEELLAEADAVDVTEGEHTVTTDKSSSQT